MARMKQKQKGGPSSARDLYYAGKMSPEEYAKKIIFSSNEVLEESAQRVRRINEELEKKRLIV